MSSTPRLAAAAALCGLLLLCACGQPPPQAFLSLPAADAVERVDPATGAVLSHTVVGKLPHVLLPSRDGSAVYAVLTGSQAVAELDARTGALRRTFLTEPVPAARADGTPIEGHVAQDAFAHTTCFACHGQPGGPRPAIVGGRPFDAVLSEDGTRLLVTNQRSGTLSRIVLETGALEAVLPLAPTGAAKEPTALARLGDSLFVTLLPVLPSTEPGVVRRLGADGSRVLSEVPTGPNAGTLSVDAERGHLYVSHFESNAVSRLDAQGRVLARYTVGNGPLGHALSEGGALYVANYYDNSVSRVDPASGAVRTGALVHEGRPLPNPTHLAPHDGALYALSSGTRGHLLTLDPDTLQLRSSVDVAGLPFDLLLVTP